MSTLWSAPDPRRVPVGTPAYDPTHPAVATRRPSAAQDAYAGTLAALVTVLVGAPVGLLWAAFAPRTEVVLAGQDVQLVQPGSSAFIAADGYFLLAVTVAGVVGGIVAWLLGREHGPSVVGGLALGGLAAAYVAMVVGEQVGRAELEAALRAGQQGALELTLRLRAQEALVGWPVGALVGYLGASFVRGR